MSLGFWSFGVMACGCLHVRVVRTPECEHCLVGLSCVVCAYVYLCVCVSKCTLTVGCYCFVFVCVFGESDTTYASVCVCVGLPLGCGV